VAGGIEPEAELSAGAVVVEVGDVQGVLSGIGAVAVGDAVATS
jgi:hypothetical protein